MQAPSDIAAPAVLEEAPAPREGQNSGASMPAAGAKSLPLDYRRSKQAKRCHAPRSDRCVRLGTTLPSYFSFLVQASRPVCGEKENTTRHATGVFFCCVRPALVSRPYIHVHTVARTKHRL